MIYSCVDQHYQCFLSNALLPQVLEERRKRGAAPRILPYIDFGHEIGKGTLWMNEPAKAFCTCNFNGLPACNGACIGTWALFEIREGPRRGTFRRVSSLHWMFDIKGWGDASGFVRICANPSCRGHGEVGGGYQPKCITEESRWKLCSACEQVYYCCRSCQEAHWLDHKHQCKLQRF